MKKNNIDQNIKITFILVGLVIIIVLTWAGSTRAATWTQKSDMPTARMVVRTNVVDGKIYAIGALQGSNRLTKVEQYDPQTDIWTPKTDMPTPRVFLGTNVVDGLIYAMGGTEYWRGPSLATVEIYDPVTDTWTRKADMPTARITEVASVDGIIYAIGGYRDHVVIATVEAYDPVTDTWTRKANMPTARGLHSLGVVNGKIYALGGQTQNTFNAFATVEVYDPATDTWVKKADMPERRTALGSCVLDETIYVFGGRATRGGSPLSTVFRYDTTTDTWTQLEDMPIRNGDMGVSTVGRRMYLIGGSSADYPFNSVLSTVWEYDIGLRPPSPDFNGDGVVDDTDATIMVEYWHTNRYLCDIAPEPWGDGIVDVQDMATLIRHLGQYSDDLTLISHWALDESEGNVAMDSVTNNNGQSDGLVFGEPFWLPNGGKVDGAVVLDGVDDYIFTGTVMNPADGPFSILAWIDGGAPGQVVISEPGGSNWLSTDPVDGHLMTELASRFGRSSGPLLSDTVITDVNWHRIGLVWDGSHRMLYVDGVRVAQDTQDDMEVRGAGMYIGTGSTMAPGTYFSGLIDDVRVYNRAVRP